MTDLIANLRMDYPQWMEDEQPGEVIATYKGERVRAAAALEAKDAEIAKLSENALEISKIYGRELDGAFRLCAEIAALKARLAAAGKGWRICKWCGLTQNPEEASDAG